MNDSQNAIIQLSLASQSTPDAAARAFLSQDGMDGSTPRRTTINGLPALTANFQATTQQATLVGSAAFVAHDGNVFQLLGYGTTSAWRSARDEVQRTFGSFGELRDPDALSVEPLRVDIVTLPSAMTLQQFAERYPSEISLEQLALINQREVGATIGAGTKLKWVVK